MKGSRKEWLISLVMKGWWNKKWNCLLLFNLNTQENCWKHIKNSWGRTVKGILLNGTIEFLLVIWNVWNWCIEFTINRIANFLMTACSSIHTHACLVSVRQLLIWTIINGKILIPPTSCIMRKLPCSEEMSSAQSQDPKYQVKRNSELSHSIFSLLFSFCTLEFVVLWKI